MSARRPHVVVLAGGEGTRLASLTRALYGVDLPKQFAVLDGDRSLLQATIDRALALTTAERISVVVSAHHEATARAQLARTPGVELVVQPRNLDTAPGLLLPLVRILVRAPHAHVVFLPSDHYVRDAEPLLEALRDSAEPGLAGRITLIGVAPTEPEIEYGWIERGSRLARTGAFAVRGFHEKPAASSRTICFARARCGTRSSRPARCRPTGARPPLSARPRRRARALRGRDR